MPKGQVGYDNLKSPQPVKVTINNSGKGTDKVTDKDSIRAQDPISPAKTKFFSNVAVTVSKPKR